VHDSSSAYAIATHAEYSCKLNNLLAFEYDSCPFILFNELSNASENASSKAPSFPYFKTVSESAM